MSLFGNMASNTGTTGGTSLFGNPSTTTTTQPTTSLFGNPSTTQAGTNPTPATGGLFGSTTTSTTQPGTGLFGASTNNPKPPTSLFGGGATGTTPAAGTSTGGLFGNAASTAQQPTTGGLFGSATNTQQQQQPVTGGLFGTTSNTQQQPATGGLFGSTTNAPTQPATTGGLFGSTQPSNTGTTGTSGGLFGSSTTTGQTPAPTGGLFGNTSAAQPGAGGATGGLFGSTTTQPTGSLFGSTMPKLGLNTSALGTTAPNSLFGGQQQQQQPQQQQQQQQQSAQPSLFGQSVNNNTGLSGSMLGGSTAIAPARSLLSSIQPQSQDPQSQNLMLMQKIEGTYSAWNPASPQCRFRHVFYNMVNPNQTAMYSKPPNMPDDMWAKATKENPDPKRLVPVMASSFDDLRERVNGQSAQAEKHKQYITELKKRIDTLQERHATTNIARLKRLTSQETQLQHRLVAFIQHLHLLIPAVRSSAIKPEEEQLRTQLEEIEEEVMKRGRVRGKLNELWALIGAVGAAQERGPGGRRGADGGGGWAVVDDEGLAQIAQILSEQQSGLAHLTKVLQQDLKDLNVVMGKNSRAGEET